MKPSKSLLLPTGLVLLGIVPLLLILLTKFGPVLGIGQAGGEFGPSGERRAESAVQQQHTGREAKAGERLVASRKQIAPVHGKGGVQGWILDPARNGLPGIRVGITAFDLPPGLSPSLAGYPIHTLTDEHGSFRIPLQAGKYGLFITLPLNGGRTEWKSFTVPHRRWIELPHIEIEIPECFRGRLVGPDGRPVQDALMTLTGTALDLGSFAPRGEQRHIARSNGKGEFLFHTWPCEFYGLNIKPPAPLVEKRLSGLKAANALQHIIRLEKGYPAEFDLRLPRLPMQLRLLAAEAGQSDGSWHRVDSNGIWRAQPHHVKRGRYRLDAKLDLPWPQPVASLSLDLPSSSVIEVPLARGTEVVLVLENSGRRLPGTVLVKLWRRLEQFSLGQLPVVRHCVTLPELPAGSYAFEVTARGLTTTKSKRIRLDGKPGGKRARLALDAEARLTGRILTAVGKPVANLWLLLRKQSPRDNARGRVLAAATKELLRFEMQTDKTGSFSFSGLARGSYSLYLLGGDERTPIAKGPLGYGENQRLELRLDSHQRTRHW